MRIALIDYRAGNLTSVRKALAALQADVWSPTDPDELSEASGLIVPGVGHFRSTSALDPSWHRAVLDCVAGARPLLGICLGMQWLFEHSTEAPDLPGLGLLAGECTLLAGRGPEGPLKVPHVGWNALHLIRGRGSLLLEGVEEGAYVYFTHSYVAPVTDAGVATTTHGDRFASAVEHHKIFGVQFHPEKSGDVGLRILNNFLSVVRTTD